MKKIKIQPFPNLKITERAFKEDVQKNVSKKKSKTPNKILVTIAEFKNGEKRVNFIVPDKKNGKTYLAFFPNPIQLYFSLALNQYNSSEELRTNWFIQSSKKGKNKNEYFLDSQPDETNTLYNSYLQLRVGSIIMLACTIEAFVNHIIPENMIYTREDGEELDRNKIQRYLSLKDKVEKVIPIITKIDIKKERKELVNRINALSRIRNEFVHLKNYSNINTGDDYHKLFKTMQNFNILIHLKSICEYMNLIKPEFIKEIK